MNLSGRIVRTDDVTDDQLTQMLRLMQRNYENVRRDDFERDFREKDRVIVAEDPGSKRICGFSTQVMLESVIDQQPVRVLFSGDTIVDPKYWSKNPLAQLWGRWVLTLIDRQPNIPLYWFLISKGYKTYRFLPVFFHDFYPRNDQLNAAWATKLIGEVAAARYPDRFDRATGIVRADLTACRLRAGIADVTSQRRSDPHVEFFCERNPGHTRGDELCCVALLTRENLNAAAWRVIGRTPADGSKDSRPALA